MKIPFLMVAALLSLVPSMTWAQEVSVVSFSAAAFGHDHSFGWSQESNLGQMVAPFLADEVRNQTKQQLENVGLALLDARQSPEVIVKLDCFTTQGDVSGALIIELYDASTKLLLWRAIAHHALNQRYSREHWQKVDRTIAKMFKDFPYHVNGWLYADRR
jgi:hypothetical protein